MEKRAGNISNEQKTLLLEYLNENPKLISAKFSSDFSFKDAQAQWTEIAEILNAVPGARKTWNQWRKTWHDIRTKTKGKKANINRNFTKTGGGPPLEVCMTQMDEAVAKLIGPTTIHGHASVDESIVEFAFEETAESDKDIAQYIQKKTATDQSKIPSSSSNALKEAAFRNEFESNIPKPKVAQHSKDNGKENRTSFLKSGAMEEHDTKFPMRRSSGKSGKQRNTRAMATKRLNETLSYTTSLAANADNDLMLRRSYYNKKVELLERDVTAKERIARAIEMYNVNNNATNDAVFENEEYLDETCEFD